MPARFLSRLSGLLLAMAVGVPAPGAVRAQPAVPKGTAAASTTPASTTAATMDDAASIGNSIATIIGVATFGLAGPGSPGIQLTREGGGYRIRMPLAAADPPAAAVTGIATPAGDGGWDIGQLAFPSTVTLHPWKGEAVYAIGSQSASAHVDPTLAHPSTWAAKFGDVESSGIIGPVRTSQHIGHYRTNGRLTPAGGGLLDLAVNGQIQDWNFLNSGGPGGTVKAAIRDTQAEVTVTGLDAAKAGSLRQHLRDARLAGESAPAGAPLDGIRAFLMDATGLLRRLEATETLRGLTFETRPAATGTPVTGAIGEMTTSVAVVAENTDLDARLDMAMDQLTLSSVSAVFKPYLPRNISVRHIVKGIPGAQIMALLQAAMSGMDADTLRMQATGLLASPDARIGIDPFSFDAGPLQAAGSARLTSGADGSVIGRVHLTATGMDALLSEIAGTPALSQLAAGLFLAKGMAKTDGQALVWDIDFGKGPPLVNGIPVGAAQADR